MEQFFCCLFGGRAYSISYVTLFRVFMGGGMRSTLGRRLITCRFPRSKSRQDSHSGEGPSQRVNCDMTIVLRQGLARVSCAQRSSRLEVQWQAALVVPLWHGRMGSKRVIFSHVPHASSVRACRALTHATEALTKHCAGLYTLLLRLPFVAQDPRDRAAS